MSNLAYDSYIARNGVRLTLDLAEVDSYGLPSGGHHLIHDESAERSGNYLEDLDADLSSAIV